MKFFPVASILMLASSSVEGFGTTNKVKPSFVQKMCSQAAKALAIPIVMASLAVSPVLANDLGASSAANAKITTGGASTLQTGRTIGM